MTEVTSLHPSSLSRGTLLAGCLAVCLAQMAIAMPAVLNGLFQTDLHPIGSQLTWISDAILLPVTVLELTFGVLGDLFGRKRLLVGGTALIAVGEIVSASAGGVHGLWLGQAITGLGAAAVFPTSLAMIAAGTHTVRERARGISVWAAALSTGGFVAPVVAGITSGNGSWRTAFVVAVVLAALSTLVSLALAKNSSAPEGRSLDWGGQVTILIGLFALLYAVIQGQSDGWGAPSVIVAFVVAAVFLVLFVVAEARARAPMLRLDLFRSRPFTVASIIAVVGMFSFLGTAYAISIRLGPIQHQTPLRAAAAFVMINGLALVMTPLTSRLLERVNPRWLLGGGLLLIAAGDFIAAGLDVRDTALTSLVLPLVLLGLGFALTVSSITATAVNTVPNHYAGMASASTSLLRDLGFTLGPAIIGAIALSSAASTFTTNLATSALAPQVRAAATAVAQEGGPLAINSVPPASPPGQAASIAVDALGNGYSIGFLVCGIAALLCSLLAVTALRGGRGNTQVTEDSLAEDTALTPQHVQL
jgi:MFS family permease